LASKTSDIAGDGTTTATVLAQAIYREGTKNVTTGANPMACVNVVPLRRVAHGNGTHSRSHRNARSANSCRHSDFSLSL
jgi:hypothetical protein